MQHDLAAAVGKRWSGCSATAISAASSGYRQSLQQECWEMLVGRAGSDQETLGVHPSAGAVEPPAPNSGCRVDLSEPVLLA